MTPVGQLDFVLKFLVEVNEFGSLTDGQIERELNSNKEQISAGTLIKVLKKLRKDGYVDVEERVVPPSRIPVNVYRISWEGEVFIAADGYSYKSASDLFDSLRMDRLEKQSERNGNSIVFLTYILAIGTSIAAVYYILEIIKNFKTK